MMYNFKKRRYCYSFLLSIVILVLQSNSANAQRIRYDLEKVIELALENSISYKISKSINKNKLQLYYQYKKNFLPRLSLNSNIVDFRSDFFGVVQPDGTMLFRSRNQNYSNVALSLSKPMAMTGGTISINSFLNRFDDLDRDLKQYNSIPFNIAINQPVLSVNPYKWERKIEPIKLSEANKELISSSYKVKYEATIFFFNVLDAQISSEIARKNLKSQENLLKIEVSKTNFGTTTKDKILRIKLQVLKYRQDLERIEIENQKSLNALNAYLGASLKKDIDLVLPQILPRIMIDRSKLIMSAKNNRPEFDKHRRTKTELEYELEKSKKNQFALNLNLGYGLNGTDSSLGNAYNNNNSQKYATIGISMPILDWGRNKVAISIARSNLETNQYSTDQENISILNEVRHVARNLALMHSNFELVKEITEIATERFNTAEADYSVGRIGINDYYIALSERDESTRLYIKSIRDFWISYHQLNLLTLDSI